MNRGDIGAIGKVVEVANTADHTELEKRPVPSHTWVPVQAKTSWWGLLWSRFWAVPMALSFTAVILGILMPLFDRVVSPYLPVFFDAGASGARSTLTTIAQAMISVTGLVFSITMVVLQLASSQFTPRVVGNFQDSRIVQFTMGTFIGTFLYALTVVRSVKNEPEFVPQISTTFAFILVMVSMGLFLAFIRQIMLSINMSEVLYSTEMAGLRVIDDIIPDKPEGAAYGQPLEMADRLRTVSYPLINPGNGGHLCEMALGEMVDYATENDACIVMEVQTGDYIPAGYQVGMLYSAEEIPDAAEVVTRMINFGRERNYEQDAAFAIRQLVDIAERALSPGTNDPTTASQVLNGLHSIARVLVTRRVPDGFVSDEDGDLRLIYQPQQIPDLLRLSFEEIAFWGAATLQIPQRVKNVLEELQRIALPDYQETLCELVETVESFDESASKPS